ncbi:posphoenolpyruvate synthetase regulatory kinase/phosphorylase PpsR [Kingella negevensis]|uniref:posphoenolpyruvate synthetase regulatory kinase/phosphorylase PpsR n=1 Tax=Kingella negevensis TaxID=1522312 RepID=UPI00050A0E8C|nr:pyruvate, water dikinase regulatory protein [Kingella negevensis]MDK4688099.1 kinase/pyrophosphorylase [Kingella negevensis]WII90918.1 kinase/pyrophosphorylase [Kingella negevensis]WII92351.1 kinase/pyrophosphorylase [Kingella negevensis]
MNTYPVFFVSDRTGLTSENMGNALLEQFIGISFKRATYPFLDTPEKAHALVQIINQAAEQGARPLVFSSVVNNEIRAIITTANAFHLSFFDAFLGKLEEELNAPASHIVQSRVQNVEKYDARMEAVNFALNHDDGISDKDFQAADVILMGVSRSGKTPTCLYLALQYGIRAANYPLTPEDLDTDDLPRMVKNHQNKLFGLTIEPDRLHHIRQERRPDSGYASLKTCRQEVADAQAIFRRHRIPFANTTHKSVEELAVEILQACSLKRRF